MGIPIHVPATLRDGAVAAAIEALAPDMIVVAAYGILLPPAVLSIPVMGCINVHGSLLPRWRGAAPIQRAILAGDDETGVTIMRMDPGMDTGDMLARAAVPIGSRTSGELHDTLSTMGAELLTRVIGNPDQHPPVRQEDAHATIAQKIDKSECRLDFRMDAVAVERSVRAFNPSPGAWTTINGERVRILHAEIVRVEGSPGEILDEALTIGCGEHAVRAMVVQRAGRRVCKGRELVHAMRLQRGQTIGTTAGEEKTLET